MAIYTFYPCRPDGSATTFQALDLADDAGARGRALRLLELHDSSARVEVWCGDRKVLTQVRAPEPAFQSA